MKFKHLQEESLAIDFLADHLIKGTLVLFLGAGTSFEFGLPGWLHFANEFRAKVGLPPIAKGESPEAMQHAMDEALDKIGDNENQKIRYVREILYPFPGRLDVDLALSNRLVISLSSLLMGSTRGHVKRVVTFNYDSMLEWFLSLFGFGVNTISDLPSLEGAEDVRIYHPHGFVPHPILNMEDSSKLILGLKDANKFIGGREVAWREKERQLLESGVGLFVGMSGNTLSDRAIAPLLSDIGDRFKEIRPLGFWIYFDPTNPVLEESKRKEFFRNNIIPIEIQQDTQIHEFILKISQKALEKQKKIS